MVGVKVEMMDYLMVVRTGLIKVETMVVLMVLMMVAMMAASMD